MEYFEVVEGSEVVTSDTLNLTMMVEDSEYCYSIKYAEYSPGCMDHQACNYDANANVDNGSCDFQKIEDAAGTTCCPYEKDACDVCEGNNSCMSANLAESVFLGQWNFEGWSLYSNADCSDPHNCSGFNSFECSHYGGCYWNGINCIVDENKFPNQIDLSQNGNYSMLFSYDRECADNIDICQLEFGDQFNCNIDKGRCESIINNQWTTDEETGDFCLRRSVDGIMNWDCMEASLEENELHINAASIQSQFIIPSTDLLRQKSPVSSSVVH
jgi:hypothetical protein